MVNKRVLKMKVIQIGTGGWGKNHCRVLSEFGVLSAICDMNYERAKEFGEKYNVNYYKTLEELFDGVRQIHFKSYLYYLYFSIGRLAYLQANVLAAYVFLAPAIVAGVMTLGVMQQIIRAFGRVEGSLQYLFRAWPTIIELASVYKRLREFENKIEKNIQDEKTGIVR